MLFENGIHYFQKMAKFVFPSPQLQSKLKTLSVFLGTCKMNFVQIHLKTYLLTIGVKTLLYI